MVATKRKKVAFLSNELVRGSQYLKVNFNFGLQCDGSKQIYYYMVLDLRAYERFVSFRTNTWTMYFNDMYYKIYDKNLFYLLAELGIELIVLTPFSIMFENLFWIQTSNLPYIVVPYEIVNLIDNFVFNKRQELPRFSQLLP